MNPFSYERASSPEEAVRLAVESAGHAKYLGGGTNLVDLMRQTIETPDTLIDVSGLSQTIEVQADGRVVIGAEVKNTALAADATIRRDFPMLSRALLAGASGQIRNMATVAGNILQRTRCAYFYDSAARCNKRKPGLGCDALDGFNRYHAVLGTSPACIASHPSDMCVALAALDASIQLVGPTGQRVLKLAELHRLPQGRPDIETNLTPGELITAIEIPPLPFARHSTYRKVRDRSSYAFALFSVAAAVDLGPDGLIRDIRLALGGVATKPWRALKAEAALRGEAASPDRFAAAADAELADAVGLRDNAFKIELAKRTIGAVLSELMGA